MDTPGVSLSTPPITSSDNPTHRPSQSPTTPQPTSTHATTSSSTSSRTRPKIPPYRLTTLPIHTDMSYSPQTHTLSCSLELPGVHPSHLRLSLGTCYFNHVKYVGVVAESVPVFGRESVLPGGAAAPGERQEAEAEEEEARRGLTAEMVRGIRSGLRWSDGGERFGGGEGGADHVKIGRIVNPNLRERKFGIFRRFIQVPPYTTVSPSRVLPLFLCGVFFFFFCDGGFANILTIVFFFFLLSLSIAPPGSPRCCISLSLLSLSLSLSLKHTPHSLLHCNQ